MRPVSAEMDSTRTDSNASGTAKTSASVSPAVAMATVRQVSRATMVRNSLFILGGKKSPKKCKVGLSAPGSTSTQGLNSLRTSIGHSITSAASAQKTRPRQAGSRRAAAGLPMDGFRELVMSQTSGNA